MGFNFANAGLKKPEEKKVEKPEPSIEELEEIEKQKKIEEEKAKLERERKKKERERKKKEKEEREKKKLEEELKKQQELLSEIDYQVRDPSMSLLRVVSQVLFKKEDRQLNMKELKEKIDNELQGKKLFIIF